MPASCWSGQTSQFHCGIAGKGTLERKCTGRVSEWAWCMCTPKLCSTVPWGDMSTCRQPVLSCDTMSCYCDPRLRCRWCSDSATTNRCCSCYWRQWCCPTRCQRNLVKTDISTSTLMNTVHSTYSCHFIVSQLCCRSNAVMFLHKIEENCPALTAVIQQIFTAHQSAVQYW